VFPVALGSVLALRISVPDPLALALAVWAVVLLHRRRLLGAVLLGMLAALTKESVLLVFLGVALARRDRDSLVLLGAAGAAFVGWSGYLRLVVPNAGGPADAFGVPFSGLYRAVRFWLEGYEPLGFVAVVAALGLSIVALVKRGLRHPLGPAVALQLLFLTVLTVDVLGPERNASRAVLPLTALAVVMLATPSNPVSRSDRASRPDRTTDPVLL